MSASLFKTARCGRNLTAAIRQKHTLTTGEGRQSVEAVGNPQQQPHQQMHQVVVPIQSVVPPLPPSSVYMPPNVKELEAAGKAQFSPWRTRDTSGARIAAYGGSVFSSGFMRNDGAQENTYNSDTVPTDQHVSVYDLNDMVSLDSSIQANVPQPYGMSSQAPSHFSSPDCHRQQQDDKYVAGDLQDHHQSTRNSVKKTSGTAIVPFGSSGYQGGLLGVTGLPWAGGLLVRQFGTLCCGGRLVVAGTQHLLNRPNLVFLWPNNTISDSGTLCGRDYVKMERNIYTCMTARHQEKLNDKDGDSGTSQLTARQKLQRAVKEYGATVIVFHVAISLTSLGICYLLVSSGIDMTAFIKALGLNLGTGGDGVAGASGETLVTNEVVSQTEGVISEGVDSDTNTKRAAGAATFVVAYAVHKVFAPARIGITVTATPFIVRYLRRIGFLKPPKPKAS